MTEVEFEGNAPVIETNAFYHYNIDTITAYYPAGDATWTEDIFNGKYRATFDWVPYEPSAEEEEETPVYIVAQGSCGSNVSWMIMSDGRLVIYGKGSMQFMMRSGAALWSAYADLITSVEVTAGVESIADSAFADCSNITTVSVADTVKSIGTEAFAGCESLETVIFAGDAPEIGENCFEEITFSVQYPENNTTWTEEVQENFGGDVVWVAENCEHSFGTPTIENTVNATCTENGSYEEVKRCYACGKEFRDTIIVNASGHTYDQEKVDSKYLAGDGVYYKSCKCGEKGTETFNVNEEKPDVKPVEFKDVPANAYYHDAVMWAVGNGVTSGTGDGTTFEPNADCTRGQVVTFLWRAAGKPEPTTTENPFVDVKSSDYFCKAVLWAKENNITSGTGDGTTFEPNSNCTRGQVITFLWRAYTK